MKIKCSNGCDVIVSDVSGAIKSAESESICAVLLSAWTEDDISEILDSGIIENLIEKKVINFVCIGNFAEQMHDQVDEKIYCFDERCGTDMAEVAITTFHDDEELEDAINYFVFGTESSGSIGKNLLAILNPDSAEDSKAINLLKSI